MKKKPDPIDLSKVKRYPIQQRANKTHVEEFGQPIEGSLNSDQFLASLPQFLKAADLRQFVDEVVAARKDDKPFHLLLGAHTIKVGLSPIFIDLMKRGIVTGLSFNGAGLIHDLELAFFGGTSEDVQKGLADGSFGMVEETGDLYAEAIALAEREELGLGEAGGRLIWEKNAPNRELSVFGMAHHLGLVMTVHVGIGTDIVAQHPNFDGAAVGRASHRDFRILSQVCVDLDTGGALANIGSAVILPEVFLKALTVARNVSQHESRLTTATFDMIDHYRPRVNIVHRPTHNVGKGYYFIGHHEIMVPLLSWAVKDKLKD